MTPRFAATIPPNTSTFALSTAGSVNVVSATVNVRGIVLHQARVVINSSAASSSFSSLRFGGIHLIRSGGPNAGELLPYPIVLPPDIALTVDSNDATNTGVEGRYTLL